MMSFATIALFLPTIIHPTLFLPSFLLYSSNRLQPFPADSIFVQDDTTRWRDDSGDNK